MTKIKQNSGKVRGIEKNMPKKPHELKNKKPLKKIKQKISLIEWIQFYFNKYKPMIKVAIDSAIKYIPMPPWAKIVIDIINKNSLKLKQGGLSMSFLKGKKTYIILGLFVALFALVHFNVIDVPESVWVLLTALGVGAIRAALQAVNQNKGWRTYLAVGVTVLLAGAQTFGLNIPAEFVTMIYTLTGALGVVGIREAINKLKS